MKKRIIILGLTFLSILSLVSCGSNDQFDYDNDDYVIEFKNAPEKGEAVNEVKFNGINNENGNIEEVTIHSNDSYADIYNTFVKYNLTILKPLSNKFKLDYSYKELESEDITWKRYFKKIGGIYSQYSFYENEIYIVRDYQKGLAFKGSQSVYMYNTNKNDFEVYFYDEYNRKDYFNADTKKDGHLNSDFNSHFLREEYAKNENYKLEKGVNRDIRHYEIDYSIFGDKLDSDKIRIISDSIYEFYRIFSSTSTSISLVNPSTSYLQYFFEGSVELTDKYIIIKYKMDDANLSMFNMTLSLSDMKRYKGSSTNFEIWLDYKKLDIITNEKNEYVNNGYSYCMYDEIMNENTTKFYSNNKTKYPGGTSFPYYLDSIDTLEGKTANISKRWKKRGEIYMLDISDEEINNRKDKLIDSCKNNKN